MGTRRGGLAVVVAALVASAAVGNAQAPPMRSVRITMDALHAAGGVPPGWRFTVPPGSVDAGRRAFVDLGCPSCHRVAGESFSAKATDGARGPDLTGMGSHHPAEYFVESILDPDAVLVDGPGWIGDDGHSTMPRYPDLTLRQLADVVAYLRSLRAAGAADMAAAVPGALPELPAPPPDRAGVFWVQSYDVQPGRLKSFEAWFAKEGRAALLAHDGVLRVDTHVDVTHERPWVVTVLAFRDDAALARFLNDPTGQALGQRFDEFIGAHQHRVFRRLPVYRAPTLSAP